MFMELIFEKEHMMQCFFIIFFKKNIKISENSVTVVTHKIKSNMHRNNHILIKMLQLIFLIYIFFPLRIAFK